MKNRLFSLFVFILPLCVFAVDGVFTPEEEAVLRNYNDGPYSRYFEVFPLKAAEAVPAELAGRDVWAEIRDTDEDKILLEKTLNGEETAFVADQYVVGLESGADLNLILQNLYEEGINRFEGSVSGSRLAFFLITVDNGDEITSFYERLNRLREIPGVEYVEPNGVAILGPIASPPRWMAQYRKYGESEVVIPYLGNFYFPSQDTWVWSERLDEWLSSSRELFPFMWSQGRLGWVYFETTQSGFFLYDFNSEVWEAWPDS